MTSIDLANYVKVIDIPEITIEVILNKVFIPNGRHNIAYQAAMLFTNNLSR